MPRESTASTGEPHTSGKYNSFRVSLGKNVENPQYLSLATMHPFLPDFTINAHTPEHHIYTEVLWGLDPLYWSNVKLFIADVLALQRHPHFPDTLFYVNHPIRNVEITGVIRAVDQSSSRVIYTGTRMDFIDSSASSLTNFHSSESHSGFGLVVDDSSGTIPCAYWQSLSAPLELGTLVYVIGRPSQWRDQPQITAYEISTITDPNTETMQWLEIISLKKDVYDKPLFLSPELLKKAADVLDAESANIDAEDNMDFDTLDPSKVNESNFQLAIIKHLKANDVTDFPYPTLRSSADMQRWAGRVLLCQYNTATPDPQRVSGVFERTIYRLVDEGFLIVKDKDGDVYEVVDNKRNLGPAVLEVIREAEKEFDFEAGGGVFQSHILVKVKEIPRFNSLPRHVVVEALNWLENNSDIYQVGEKGMAYRCL